MNHFEYTVAIRTLGTAGSKYQQELDSLVLQTIPPREILIYLAEGYPIPKETVGIEKYIYVKKGMAAQRALSYDEVKTEYVLLLDDDVYLAPDSVEKLYEGLMEGDAGDCIADNIFKNHQRGFLSRCMVYLASTVSPSFDQNYMFKIKRSGVFSYLSKPVKDVYRTQSAAGACSLWKLSSLNKIHFEDELWMDQYSYPLGDDQVFFYKAHRNGLLVKAHNNTGIRNLDAAASDKNNRKSLDRYLSTWMMFFVIWYRTCYDLSNNTRLDKLMCSLAYIYRFSVCFCFFMLLSIAKVNFACIKGYIMGNIKGIKFVLSNDYKKIPNFIIEG